MISKNFLIELSSDFPLNVLEASLITYKRIFTIQEELKIFLLDSSIHIFKFWFSFLIWPVIKTEFITKITAKVSKNTSNRTLWTWDYNLQESQHQEILKWKFFPLFEFEWDRKSIEFVDFMVIGVFENILM